jgi:hypothetical protein
MKNPFTIKVITNPDAFCNRTNEIAKLVSYANSDSNVVLYSPRRYGKTSLVKQVQNRLKDQKYVTIYVDLFGLSSTDNIADRIARGVYKALHTHKSLMQRAMATLKSHRPVIRPNEDGYSVSVETVSQNIFGSELLEKTLSELDHFIQKGRKKINIVLDEFQEISEIKDKNIEGLMRSHIQQHAASYFFVGSRRRILLEMFNDKRRPFFQSAINFKLDALPHDELTAFLVDRFAAGKKRCSAAMAGQIAATVNDHPYYSQKLAFFIYEMSAKSVTKASSIEGYKELIQTEAPVFEAMIQGLAPRQIALLRALAKEPSKSVMSMAYIKRHNLKSVGGIQAALLKLSKLDYIEKGDSNVWRIVDPILHHWLRRKG